METKDNARLILRDINQNIRNFKSNYVTKFNEKLDSIFKEYNTQDSIQYHTNITELVTLLVFGETNYNDNIMKKVDYNKNRNVLKNVLLNLFGIKGTLELVTWNIRYFDDFLDEVTNQFEILYGRSINEINDNEYLTNDELISFYDILNALRWESSHYTFDCGTLKSILRAMVDTEKPLNIKNLTKDTLKRYYFCDVYELKNNVKIFDTKNMFFGATNTIMRMFNRIFNYSFGDIIGIYQILYTNFKYVK